ncbi:hypothetical protein O6H91_08G029300 [Diphasiastrum complanatum]|uniref:Uncharacterized protein n=1 Tax=Diphasiastrum complanatum TaxID=34168 RepID=A0ACC2CW84_DIPCM|nr:hypothetical protein O6H91_08G029300 [Diphasiastrum complanatum]
MDDAPDANELEWMAFQHMIPDEDDDGGFDYSELPPPSPSEPSRLADPSVIADSDSSASSKQFLLEMTEGYTRTSSKTDHVKRNRDTYSGSASSCQEMSSKRARGTSASCSSPPLLDTSYVQESLSANNNLLRWDSVTAPPCSISDIPILKEDNEFPCKLPCKRAADIEGECIPVTGSSGSRVYVKILKPSTCRSYNSKIFGGYGSGLLSKPIEKMIEEAERESFEQACKSYTTEEDQNVSDTSLRTTNEELWVDKYAPKSFTELLSDEQTNREVLSWLKQWDSCVFGMKITSSSKEVLATLRRQSHSSQSKSFSLGRTSLNGVSSQGLSSSGYAGVSSKQTTDTTSNGSWITKRQIDNGELEHKVLLLCGPPGLGKTTLAHVVAKHCGYRVVEINASDDRVATTLQGKILDAIQMKSVMGDCKPNCLIIDEIDGALGGAEGKGAIASLLEIVSAEKKMVVQKESEFNDEPTQKTSKRRGGAMVHKLSRPVICICNDQYVPTLRLLRQVARLKNICHKESYKANPRALTALAEHTECDIRSCLNTLQFLHRKNEDLKTLDVASQIVGRKDMTSSIFDIWSEIFQKRKAKSASVVRSGDISERFKQEQQEFFRLHELFLHHGDYELTTDGIFENYLHIRYHDSSLQKTSKCLDLICDSEIFRRRAFMRQHFFINGYQPSFAIAIRRLIAQVDRPNIEWPKAFHKYSLEFSSNKDMLKSWLSSMSPSTSRSLSYACLVQDLVPFLLTIISPNLRTVASQLLSQVEREVMNQLVDTMLGYGISYKTSKFGIKHEYTAENQGLVLEPPLHRVIAFKDLAPTYRQLSSTLRQMIGHEVEMEKIHRESSACIARGKEAAPLQTNILKEMDVLNMECSHLTNVHYPDSTSVEDTIEALADQNCISASKGTESIQGGEVKGSQNSSLIKAAKTSAQLFANVKKPVTTAVQQSSSFFDRFKKSSSYLMTCGKIVENKATLQRDSRPLLYKFNEGFTNAIKRPMFMRDFL